MQRIAEEGLRPDLVRLVGEPFVLRLERAHAALGRALGLDGRPADASAQPTVDLAARIRDVHQAATSYALELLSIHRSASDRLAEDIVRALAPIEEFRAMAARSSSGGAAAPQPGAEAPAVPDVGPATPIPPVPGT